MPCPIHHTCGNPSRTDNICSPCQFVMFLFSALFLHQNIYVAWEPLPVSSQKAYFQSRSGNDGIKMKAPPKKGSWKYLSECLMRALNYSNVWLVRLELLKFLPTIERLKHKKMKTKQLILIIKTIQYWAYLRVLVGVGLCSSLVPRCTVRPQDPHSGVHPFEDPCDVHPEPSHDGWP